MTQYSTGTPGLVASPFTPFFFCRSVDPTLPRTLLRAVFSNKGEEKGRGCYALAVGNTTRERPRLLPVNTGLACLHPRGAPHRGQDLAVARNPIQPLVVGGLITIGPTAEHVRVLARLVVYEGIIPRPAEVFLGVQVPTM